MTKQQRWTLIAAILGSGIVFLDSTVVNVALPKIGRELPSTLFGVLEGQSYIYNGYLLTVSALLILAGALNDFYGRKRMFTLGLAGFLVTSLLCGLAPNMELLILFRILQGVAGALLVPGSLALLTVTFSGEAQGRAFGLWAAASAATTILGPFVGGVVFTRRNFTVTNIPTFLIYGALYVLGYFITLFVQGTIGFTAASAGLAFIPSGLFLVFLSSRFGALSGKYGPKVFMAVGPALMCVGTLWYARVPATTTPWQFTFEAPSSWLPPATWLVDFLPGQLLFGFGLS